MHFASTPPSHERMAIWCVNNTIFPVQAISHQYNDIVIFSKLSSAQSNSNPVGWAEIALSSNTPTTPLHPTPPNRKRMIRVSIDCESK